MLDLKKLVHNIRTMKAVLKHSLLTDEIKQEIKNTSKHVIELDNSNNLSDVELPKVHRSKTVTISDPLKD